MSSLSYTLRDSATMLRRDFKHTLRNPSVLFGAFFFPLIFLMLFVYVFGGAFAIGEDYLRYIVPGIIAVSVGTGMAFTAVGVADDMAQGIINRFRTMAISRVSVLTGHVLGSTIRTVLSTVALVGVTLLMGFRPNATFVEWVAAFGMVTLLTFAIGWLTVALGLAGKNPEAASFYVFPVMYLPFVSSAYVPTETMPSGVQWFADHQPYTVTVETLRGLLTGTPIGDKGLIAVIWCAVFAAGGYVWARSLLNRRRA